MAQQTAVSKMETTQTAVEWLIDRIKNQHLYGFTPLHELEEKAKAMEKEQTIKARNSTSTKINRITMSFEPIDGEQYYNETYNK